MCFYFLELSPHGFAFLIYVTMEMKTKWKTRKVSHSCYVFTQGHKKLRSLIQNKTDSAAVLKKVYSYRLRAFR